MMLIVHCDEFEPHVLAALHILSGCALITCVFALFLRMRGCAIH